MYKVSDTSCTLEVSNKHIIQAYKWPCEVQIPDKGYNKHVPAPDIQNSTLTTHIHTLAAVVCMYDFVLQAANNVRSQTAS